MPRENLRAKRAFDLVLGVPALIVVSPFLLIIWITYKFSGLLFREDRGPVFRQIYRQTHGRVIAVHKVRISRMEALAARLTKIKDTDVARLNQQLGQGDPRSAKRFRYGLVEDFGLNHTRFGKFIKAMYLDELPQILNIVKGDMSFVGPRPIGLRDTRSRPDQDGLVTVGGERLDYRHRDLLPGGLTGPYQASKSAAAKTDRGTFAREGVALDRHYYEQLLQSTPWKVVKNDLSIICRTIPVVLRHEGI